jgi:hypothetical protein
LKETFMRAANVFAAIGLLLWAIMLWSGVNLIHAVNQQHAPEYPNSAQIFHDIWFPSIMLAALLLAAVCLQRRQQLLKYFSAAAIACFVFYFVTAGGGI